MKSVGGSRLRIEGLITEPSISYDRLLIASRGLYETNYSDSANNTVADGPVQGTDDGELHPL